MAAQPGVHPDQFARNTLKTLEIQFFSALEEYEGRSLAEFYSSWTAFERQLDSIHPDLRPQTMEDITSFVSIMVTVGGSLADAASPDPIEAFKSSLQEDIAGPSRRQPSIAPSTTAAYIEASLRWLKSNLCNPYPSRTVRSSIAKAAKAPVKDVDAWFLDIRKRIGWSKMRQARFGNRKSDIVDAATRFYTGSDPHRPLETIVESEFAAIAATVDQLFNEKCSGTALASHLDQTVMDLTPALRVSLSEHRRRSSTDVHTTKTPRRRTDPYPTPELSPTLPPTLLSTPESPSCELPATGSSGRQGKRSRSPGQECPTDNEEERPRPTKRARRSPIPTPRTPPTSCYPSPTASIVLSLTELPTETPISAEVGPISHTGKRKRTLSDSGIVRAAPLRESTPQTRTPSNPPPLSVSDILDQAAFSPPSAPSALPEATTYESFGPFDPFFAAFMSGGAPALDATSSPLPLLNIVDEVAPTNVHVEFDQSWLSCSADPLAPSDPFVTGYNTNFDDFGGNLYAKVMDPFSSPLWYSAPPSDSLASGPCPESSTMALTGQLNVSPPSPTCLHNIASPSPNSTIHSNLTDKARELLELEARCAALRNELAAAC